MSSLELFRSSRTIVSNNHQKYTSVVTSDVGTNHGDRIQVKHFVNIHWMRLCLVRLFIHYSLRKGNEVSTHTLYFVPSHIQGVPHNKLYKELFLLCSGCCWWCCCVRNWKRKVKTSFHSRGDFSFKDKLSKYMYKVHCLHTTPFNIKIMFWDQEVFQYQLNSNC